MTVRTVVKETARKKCSFTKRNGHCGPYASPRQAGDEARRIDAALRRAGYRSWARSCQRPRKRGWWVCL